MMRNGTLAGPRVHVSRLALAVLALAPATLAAQAPTQTVTLAEAIRLAEQVRPTVIQANASIVNAAAQKRAARGAYLPTFTASASGNSNTAGGPDRIDQTTGLIIPGGQNNKSVSMGVSGRLLLFDGFRRNANSRVANAQIAAADAGFLDAKFQARLAVTNQFFTVRAASELLRVQTASVATAQEQLRQSTAKLHAGSATRSDSLRSLVALGTAQGNLANAESDLTASEATLGQLIGVDGRVSAAQDSVWFIVTPSLDTLALLREAKTNSPQIRNAEAQALSAKASWSAVKASYWPTLSLGGSYQFTGASAQDYTLYNQRSLSLNLSWNVFDGFVREQNVTVARTSYDVAEAQAADLRRQLEATVLAQLAALEAARQRIQIAETSVVAAREDLRVNQQRYSLGVATIVDVLTAQQSLTQTEVDVVRARFDYVNARALIETTVGRTL